MIDLSKLEQAVKDSTSFAEVARKLNRPSNGGSQSHLCKRIKELKFDTSHFNKGPANKDKPSTNRKSARDILVLSNKNRRADIKQLRRALLEVGRKYECVICQNPGLWQNKTLTLEIDHIDNNYLNNTLENLQFLCSNCHTQKTAENIQLRKRSKKPKKCKAKKQRVIKYKIDWPSVEDLLKELKTETLTSLGKKLGVSANAVKKHLNKINLDGGMVNTPVLETGAL